MHPNHHHNIYNHRNTTTSIPVHNSNNRLINNTVFHNNQYTFSLNRYDDSGYLESRPLSSASLYGDGQRISRGTKSDIGVPCRRPSTSKSLFNNSSNVHYNRNKDKLPSIKSDFLLSYLNNNQIEPNTNNLNVMHQKNHAHNNQHERNLNNNSESNDCINSTAYHISGVSTSDFLETYKTGAKYFYTNSSKLENNIRTHPSHTINEQQRNRIINFANRSNDDAMNDAKNVVATSINASGSYNSRQTSNVVGPLLYIDPNSESHSNNTTHSNLADTQNHSSKSVSK